MVARDVTPTIIPRTPAAIGAAALLLAATGCAHVSKDDFEAEIADVRAEMRAGDDDLSARMEGLETRLEARLAAVEADLRTLEDELDMEIERLEASLRVHTPVHFGFDSARLEGGSTEVLDRIAAVLREHYPTALVTVEGFTDPAGSAAYNLDLGRRRAETVLGWLVGEGGIGSGQVRAVSYGESTDRLVRPGEAGPGARGRENRRVVIVIDHADGPVANVVAQGS